MRDTTITLLEEIICRRMLSPIQIEKIEIMT